MTKDLQLVCSHDQWIKDSNVLNGGDGGGSAREFNDGRTFSESFLHTIYGMYFLKNEDSLHSFTNLLGRQNFSYITKTVFIHMVATIHKRILFQSCRSLFEI